MSSGEQDGAGAPLAVGAVPGEEFVAIVLPSESSADLGVECEPVDVRSVCPVLVAVQHEFRMAPVEFKVGGVSVGAGKGVFPGSFFGKD